jgi:signal transduction histidine kinase
LRRRSSRWTDQRDRHALEVVHSGLRLASRLVQENHAAETRTHSDLRQVAAIAVSQVPPPRLGDVVVNCLTELPLVGRWDQERLVQVLINLLGNAVKYSPGGTPIVVEIARLGDRGRILVRDRGIGIEAQDLDVIFEGHRTELGRLVSSGSGIGLGLSRRLVEAEGGQLGVSSSPGSGSAFWVDLPLTPPSGPSVRTKPAARQPAALTSIEALREAVRAVVDSAVREVGYHRVLGRGRQVRKRHAEFAAATDH